MTADDRIALLLGRAIMRAERLEAQLVAVLTAPAPDEAREPAPAPSADANGSGKVGGDG